MTSNKHETNSKTSLSSNREMWNERYKTKELVWSADANQFVKAETSHLQPGRALDLAAGECRNAIWLAEQGWQIQAIDFSDVAIDKGRQLATARGIAHQINFEVADLCEYEPPANYYDLVLISYLHLPKAELNAILNKAANAVKPNGTFLLIAHDSSNLKSGYGGPQNPDILYSFNEVTPILGDQFQISKASVVQREIKIESGTKIAFDCLVHAKKRA